jgi:hypothetical protein
MKVPTEDLPKNIDYFFDHPKLGGVKHRLNIATAILADCKEALQQKDKRIAEIEADKNDWVSALIKKQRSKANGNQY